MSKLGDMLGDRCLPVCYNSIIHPVLFCFGIEVIFQSHFFQKYGVLFTFFLTIISNNPYFSHGDNIRDDPVALESPEMFTGPSKTGLDFIRDAKATVSSGLFKGFC
jgi:hypothetical protein